MARPVPTTEVPRIRLHRARCAAWAGPSWRLRGPSGRPVSGCGWPPMRVGVVLFMQNFADWGRFRAAAFDGPSSEADHAIVEAELHLADLVEPLGFDSLW